MLDLSNSPEPLRQVAVVITALLTALGAALMSLSASLDWAWLPIATNAVMAAVAVLATWFGIEKGRSVVTPGPHVASLLASAEPIVEPVDVDPLVVEPPAAEVEVSLDEAARQAGLD